MGVASVASNFIMLRFLVRYMPAKEAGIWLLFMTMSSYLTVFDFGVSPTIGREISFALGDPSVSVEERGRRVRDMLATGSRILVALALALTVICGVAGYWYLGSLVDFHSFLGHQTAVSWIVFVIAVATSVSGEIWLAALYGAGSVISERLLRAAGYVLWVIASVLILRSGGGLMGLSLAWFYAFAVRLAARELFLRGHKDFRAPGAFDWKLGKSLSEKSIKYAGTLIGGTLILYTDNIVIASVLGPAKVPNYYAIARLVAACLAVAMLITTASGPFISAAFSAGNSSEVQRLTMRNVRVSLALMAAGGCFLGFFGKPLVELWIGQGNFVGFGVLIVMLCAMTLEGHHVSLATATMACGDIPFFVPALIAGFLNLAFSFPLAHRMGLVGVALGTLLAQITTNNWYVPLYSLRFLRIPWSQYAMRVGFPSLGQFALFAGCDFMLHRVLSDSGRIVQVGVGLALNGALLALLVLAQRDSPLHSPRLSPETAPVHEER